MQLNVSLGEAYQVGATSYGIRNVIPITGGTFEGPKLKGIIATGNDENGNPSFYFRCAPKFEAPADSGYAWLNNALFVCAPDFSGPQGTITLKVWKVN